MLIDYGLAENVVERLVETGIGTIEKLGGMTPEELEEIQGIEPEMVEQIQESVNAYYSQFEEGQAGRRPKTAERCPKASLRRKNQRLPRPPARKHPRPKMPAEPIEGASAEARK